MKKGDIIWIKWLDFIFCSEVKYIDKDFTAKRICNEVHLIPIIGTCERIIIDSGINFDKFKRIAVIGYFSKDSFGHYITIALNVEDLC